jgi:hypothetical protein
VAGSDSQPNKAQKQYRAGAYLQGGGNTISYFNAVVVVVALLLLQ